MTSVEHLDKLCADFIKLKKEKAEIQLNLKEKNSEISSMERNIMELLESLDKTENEGSFGKVKMIATQTFRMTDKDKAFSWLKENGKFDDLASVNQQSLSAWIKQEYAAKIEDGEVINLPGIEDKTGEHMYLRTSEKL